MTLRVGINGLGRIGRCLVRALVTPSPAGGGLGWGHTRSAGANDAPLPASPLQGEEIELVAANGPAPIETHLHLLKYDSVHGRFTGELHAERDVIVAGRHRINITHEKDPAKLDWKALGVDMVLECSGKFNSREAAAAHVKAGAKRVLISAPAPDADATIVYGVNNAMLKSKHTIVSVGSCTTNCLASLAKALHEAVGIERGFMTTIHAYTGDQNLVDSSHKDLRRARAAAMSMIPTSTGAAKTIGLVLPELAGRLDGTAIRVPVPNVSLVDLVFDAARETDQNAVNAALTQAASGVLKGVMSVCSESLVSVDFSRSPESCIVDLTGTQVMGKKLVRVAAWYDNEWGFSLRMWDVARLWGGL